VLDDPVANPLLDVGGAGAQATDPVDDVLHEMEPVEIVHHHHVERRARCPFLFVAAHVQVLVVCPSVREPMD